MHMGGHTRAGHRTGVHPGVESVAALDRSQRGHRRGGQFDHLGAFRGIHRGQVGHVPVGAEQQVPRVVRVQVQHHVAQLPAVDHQGLFVVLFGAGTERAPGAGRTVRGFVLTVDVGHPVRGPQPVVPVPDPGVLLRGIVGHTCTFVAIASVIRARASVTGTPLRWLPSRNRKETAPASASSPPAISTDRKSTRLNSSHVSISYAVFCLKKKTTDPPSPSRLSYFASTPTSSTCIYPLSLHDALPIFRGIVGHTCTFVAIASVIRARASVTGTPLRWLPSRNRKETAPASASSPPAIS